jgi:ATP-dependent Clp protease ATP-binding subunit ClpA
MFERYTEKARRVIFFARYEASQFGSPSIETEHLLLGFLRAAEAPPDGHLAIDSIRKQIEAHTTMREKIPTSVDLPLSHECKRVLAYAAEEAVRLKNKHIGAGHLLLGLLREEKSFAAGILHERGMRYSQVPQVIGWVLDLDDIGGAPARDAHPPRRFEGELDSSYFERYTEKARRAIFFARYEADQFGSPRIETEHLLLGLLREDKALANRFLQPQAMDSIRKQIEAHTTMREKATASIDLPLSHQCKRVLAYGAEESEGLSHKHVGTGHLLLGLLREEKSFAAEILHQRGLRLSQVRDEIGRST